jgi:6-pyruvoyltetrahydropterin/6-carboxytetrahydropterin synthase
MFRLKVQDHFSSAHYLKNYQGPCENLHGHNWKVELVVEGSKLNSTDILIDFKILKNILKEVLSELDHKLLNEIPYFKEVNPSSEKIAEYIFNRVKEKLASYSDVKVKEVTVFETDKASATYYED